MPLSERERKVLQQLERELFIQDPDLARQLESGVPVRGPVQPRMRDVLAVAVGVLLILLAVPLQAFPITLAGILLAGHGMLAHRAYKNESSSRLL
ncbi:DUF3040 domain-containing protein [Arthrobacter sp. ISL-95]|uniref:DUF3040 domain-containing protein n=1 Tax=Arthrobacter sp. ISL-95 TaxID=2819116 RepID=UPI001BEA1F82|nr:DUF3040 domain-containing protein [Arthrobacter sp. ISL-95]MBT2587634.1 DUF3040 domain-containing protein [Arthrobacter sp. ISL-95]